MINTWNPAEISDKLNQLEGQIQANDVIANPTGEATETLTKIGIDGDIYSFTAETTAADVSYDNTSSGLTADDVQNAIDELKTGVNGVIALYATTMVTIGNVNIEADTDYEWELSLSKPGYTPIGVLGWEQKGSRYFYLLNLYVDTLSSKLKAAVHCSTNTTGARYDVVIFWIKN